MNREQFYNITLENDLLSILLNDQNALGEVIGISNDIYYNSNNKVLYDVIEVLWKEGKAINPSTIYGLLKTDIDKVGGISRITELHTNYINSHGYKDIIEELKDYKLRRDIYKFNNDLKNMFESEIDTKSIVSNLSKSVDKVLMTDIDNENGEIEEGLEILGRTLEERYKKGDQISGIATNLTALDYKINGLNKQQMYIVAGRPGSGKTTLANNIALRLADQQRYVAVFNLEMSKPQILATMLSNVALVENDKLKSGNLSDKEWENIGIGQNRLLKMNKFMKLYDTVTNLHRIVAIANKLKKQNKLDVLIVDYLQLIETSGNKDNRQQQVSEIARTLKLLSKNLEISVIALSQLSRAPELRADHRPILSDLRESGAIEQDADTVLFTYRDAYYNAETEEPNVLEVIVGKQRDGSTGTVKLQWIPQYFRVSNLIRV